MTETSKVTTAPARPKFLRKGEQTRAAILDVALELASRDGLEGLTIGLLAEKMKMSKSGVFAHFGSREDLQIEVVRLYHNRFEADVFYPSIKEPRGLPRLEAMFARWVKQVTVEIALGCIYISGAVEYDDRPGAIRDHLVAMVQAWRDALERCIQQAIDAGHLRPEVDVSQMVYEMYGLILALHHDARFLHIPGSVERAEASFRRLIGSYRPQGSDSLSSTPAKHSKSAARKAA
ncbi:TetR/AcrR family transcriptional regulator [Herbaspirillum seropedicae]|uniref:Transcription regulator protein n=1 Tax=Herbaspirillum seropedicae (strain SmR1) TaxID=757424 RepID=D8IV60_HERSS|nr:TetR/AcrR family transcriptional regulator [Herbaspirillum seropedicae]ADJ61779.1 transcription regulator protein [Herbaspirillum seropedicae SmR1]AKN63974.1 TetR family transcriptional regulator [Herbaspirillum seropedicae]NQE29349.1 TetR family transcriptional regulator [Herbaspirillum seropedicae]UMU19889.1 TetR/AcrR family transcriptional regulator [Herbaspirillum seropedicae]